MARFEQMHVRRPMVALKQRRVNLLIGTGDSASQTLKSLSSHPKPRFFHFSMGSARAFLSARMSAAWRARKAAS
eukprot:6203845-Pleurochrysis_carterae.AAC.3